LAVCRTFWNVRLTCFWYVQSRSDIFAAKLQAQNFGGVLLDQFQVSLDTIIDGHLDSKRGRIDKLSNVKLSNVKLKEKLDAQACM
jgi:hypothetical protein